MQTTIAARLFRCLSIAGAIATIILPQLPAQAQASTPAAVTASASAPTPVPMYQGADRAQRLIAGAKREGTLTVYTSMAAKDSAQIVSGFEKKYGIKVALWRAGKQTVLQRVLTEARARHNEVDLITLPSPEMEALHREQLLQPAFSPLQQELIPVALPAHREWVGTRANVYVQVYNTQKISRDELPRTYEDLLDPRWKGKLGIEAKGQEWFYVLLQTMGEEKGLRFFQELVAKNGVSVRSGMTLLSNMIASGEVPFGLTVYSYLAEQSKARGAPVDFITLSPTVAHTDGIGISRNTPHPYAAMLFYDYLLSDGQRMVAAGHGLTTNRRDEAALARFNPTFIDPALLLDHLEKWTQMYNDTLQGRTPAAKP
ncbi:MAG TPA: extracellular solute-binding protein [Herbaspirillum sp.]|jgi:iron(III) transport system substrate-binding protein